jgi:hypothetical protein
MTPGGSIGMANLTLHILKADAVAHGGRDQRRGHGVGAVATVKAHAPRIFSQDSIGANRVKIASRLADQLIAADRAEQRPPVGFAVGLSLR